jgi:hypothetical protein
MALIKCNHCGKPVSDRATTCPHCGKALQQAVPQAEPKQALAQPATVQPEAKENLQTQQVAQPTPQPQQTETPQNNNKGGNTIVNLLIIVIALMGGCLTVLPLFGLVYNFGTHYTPFYNFGATSAASLAVGFAGLGVLVCLGIIIFSLVQLAKSRQLSSRVAICSLALSIAMPLCTYFLLSNSFNSFYSLYLGKTQNMVGLYEFEYDGKAYFFGTDINYIANQHDFVVNANSSMGLDGETVRTHAYCAAVINDSIVGGELREITYYCHNNSLLFVLKFPNSDYVYAQAGVDLANVRIGDKTIPLTKISNDATKNALVSAIAARLEELKRIYAEKKAAFMAFQTDDLTAFMLHGKVKTVTEDDMTLYFDENGTLVKCVNRIYDKMEKASISHGEGLTIRYSQYEQTITVRDKKIIENGFRMPSDNSGSRTYYGDYAPSLYGWPTSMVCDNYDQNGEVWSNTTYTISYPQIDDFGNWTKCVSNDIDEGNETVETRTITYYPIE